MIKSFTVKDPNDMPVEWWGNVPLLAKPQTFDFAPGLNVVFGPNGCGKSTLLTAIAKAFYCHQMGRQSITENSIREMLTKYEIRRGKSSVLRSGFSVGHDAGSVFHFSPESNPGFIGGMAGFDWDCGSIGIERMMSRGSSGQNTLRDLFTVIGHLQAKKPRVDNISEGQVNSTWAEWIKAAKKMIETPTIKEKGNPCLLLDEPCRSLDLPYQIVLWDALVKRWSPTAQVIVATHNPIIFGFKEMEEANFIDLSGGYLGICRKCVKVSLDVAAAHAAAVGSHEEARKAAESKGKS